VQGHWSDRVLRIQRQGQGREGRCVLYLWGIVRRGTLQSLHHYTLKTTTTPTPRQCRCRMLSPRLCPDLRQPAVARLKTCTSHCCKIGVPHSERGWGARCHMPHLVSAPQPAGRGFNVRVALWVQRHLQFGTHCVLACWTKRVRNQHLQVRGKSGNWDQGGGVWLYLGGSFPCCPPIMLLRRLSRWAPCGSLLGGAWSQRFPIIIQRKPQLLLKGPEQVYPLLLELLPPLPCGTWPLSVLQS
jgi:hypothetical protein